MVKKTGGLDVKKLQKEIEILQLQIEAASILNIQTDEKKKDLAILQERLAGYTAQLGKLQSEK